MTATLEHANLTVSDPKATAGWMCDLFDWHIRWQGAAINGGFTVHVGAKDSYLALYAPKDPAKMVESTYATVGGLNHVGIVVDDLNAVEARVKSAGFTPYNHADYDPGKRFYFDDNDGVEYEVVAYS